MSRSDDTSRGGTPPREIDEPEADEPRSPREMRKARLWALQRSTILDAAERVFVRDGYHAAKMTDIAQQAGFSAGSLYTYFDGKEAIFQAMVAERLGLLYELLEGELGRSTDSFFELIARLAVVYANFMDERRNFMRILHAAYPVGSIGVGGAGADDLGQAGDAALDSYHRFAGLIERVISRGVEEKVIRDLPARDMATIFLGMMDAANQLWLTEDPPGSFAERVPIVLDVLLNGVKL